MMPLPNPSACPAGTCRTATGRPAAGHAQTRREAGSFRTVLALAGVVLLLAGCQSGPLARLGDTMFSRLSGGQFTLHRDFTIPPGRVRVIFQEGRAGYGASEFLPRCELEVYRLLEVPQTISAGRYRIGTVRGMQRYVDRPPGKVMLAAAEGFRLADDGSSEWYMFTYRMPLLGDAGQEAAMLICGGAYNYPAFARYPTLQEMQEALGAYATLTPR